MHGKRFSLIHTEIVKEKSLIYKERIIDSPKAAADFAAAFFKGSDREKVYIACLDAKGEIVSMELISVGTVDKALIGIAEVFKTAIMQNASKILLMHFHPSGSTKPSTNDILVTKRVKEVGELMGINLADHIIIGDEDNYYSFTREETL
ncbi:JAB domain-containing protein [[Clostridium] fimetarium]|uniref:DNA repair protein RadC n=1 Tax=[Clostridium] fimetarium TaxID=99656 RepID=A0A1I0Q192_9FIRM|nr:JAB domain-containing protein [[Clostridium] fimetarium]SEW20297.1 DNA repair protein RadC [[Clostridium] fimetarium]